MSVKPSFSASWRRTSMRLTGRTSPDSPTSPHRHQPWGMGVSTLLDRTAAITERSIAVSVTLMPPAMLRNTSFCTSLNPTLFSSTARSIPRRRWSKPVAVRWGVPYAAEETSAWVSMSSGRIPSMATAIATPDMSGASSPRSDKSSSDGFKTGRRPPVSISYIPSSCARPKRFFMLRSMR